jgi:hypothetical protein
MRKIAISGPIASGKTTVLTAIVGELKCEREAFARPLKEFAEAAILDTVMRDTVVARLLQRLFAQRASLGIRACQIYESLRHECSEELEAQREGKKARVFLQKLGSGFRELDVDVWAKDIIARTSDGRSYVVDDLRYENEARILRDNGWRLVRCDVSEKVRRRRIEKLYGEYDDSILRHPSEIGLDDWDDWDYVINTGVPLKDQSLEVSKMMEALF